MDNKELDNDNLIIPIILTLFFSMFQKLQKYQSNLNKIRIMNGQIQFPTYRRSVIENTRENIHKGDLPASESIQLTFSIGYF